MTSLPTATERGVHMRHRLSVLAVTAMVLGACGASCLPRGDEEPIIYNDSFETGLGAWTQGADVPEDPNNPGQPVEWSIEQGTEQAVDGQYSAKYSLDGTQDDGTIWLVREFDVTPLALYRVTLSFDLWSETESFNTLAKVAAYAGGKAPEVEADFDVNVAANEVAGWKSYTYVVDAIATLDGKIRVAFGISAVWETELTYYIDDVQIEIVPR